MRGRGRGCKGKCVLVAGLAEDPLSEATGAALSLGTSNVDARHRSKVDVEKLAALDNL